MQQQCAGVMMLISNYKNLLSLPGKITSAKPIWLTMQSLEEKKNCALCLFSLTTKGYQVELMLLIFLCKSCHHIKVKICKHFE